MRGHGAFSNFLMQWVFNIKFIFVVAILVCGVIYLDWSIWWVIGILAAWFLIAAVFTMIISASLIAHSQTKEVRRENKNPYSNSTQQMLNTTEVEKEEIQEISQEELIKKMPQWSKKLASLCNYLKIDEETYLEYLAHACSSEEVKIHAQEQGKAFYQNCIKKLLEVLASEKKVISYKAGNQEAFIKEVNHCAFAQDLTLVQLSSEVSDEELLRTISSANKEWQLVQLQIDNQIYMAVVSRVDANAFMMSFNLWNQFYEVNYQASLVG